MLVDSLIFILAGGLVVAIVARLKFPLNLILTALVMITLATISRKLFDADDLAWLLLAWQAALVAVMYGLRYWLHHR
ncbi:hypothetical protein [Lacticaseibacillus yichunensis]|nr:hypothetical protein [Lacticaseibacillus yichunensis]